ncbi:dihydrodipicolinate reductase [Hypnocyclicus thermotrophus]|uniref:4-hydroxy-tetrahydrodipicolinate reductase n=1 Tax=Hypnocyclicus thermotrophus TaxID=1627895 RepID=A0AA46E0R4_9FUSO|nr:4-hydroxy-tetrahydrodipicolinate reductase [Hypnocyclicus thermotrophus]TDT72363.1 dihydrodipicolinate reductase [Hypnocyclicus thermotrophus]
MNIAVYGYGNMGKLVCDEVQKDNSLNFVAAIDPFIKEETDKVYKSLNKVKENIDVIIDFSNPANIDEILEYCIKNDINLLIATTGFSKEQEKNIKEASKKIGVLQAANTSLGVNLIAETIKYFAQTLYENFDIEIIEKHHNQKVDSPSGTAKLFFNAINDSLPEKKEAINGREGIIGKRTKNEIGIHAVRGGSIVGEHTIIFAGTDEIIEVKHEALSKRIFAKGAVVAAKYLINKPAGNYKMKEVLNLK